MCCRPPSRGWLKPASLRSPSSEQSRSDSAQHPLDLHLLPDGGILVVSQREIAIGDGVRWETYQQAADQTDFIYSQVGVDNDGRIYAGKRGPLPGSTLG